MLIFLSSCATVPKNSCSPEGVHFIILKGFEVEHDSCLGLKAISWKIEINLCENGKWKTTNLWSFWNGCRYKLIQQNKNNTIDIIGKFKTLDDMKRFLEITMPMTRIK